MLKRKGRALCPNSYEFSSPFQAKIASVSGCSSSALVFTRPVSAEYKNGDTSLRSVLNFSSSQVIADGKWRRYSVALTDSGTTSGARAVFFCTGTTGDGIECGEIAMPQTELGTVASTYIQSSSSTTTRPAEVFSVDLQGLLAQSEGSLFIDFSLSGGKAPPSAAVVARLKNSSGATSLTLREGIAITGMDLIGYDEGVLKVDTSSVSLPAGSHRAGMKFGLNNIGFTLNGAALVNQGAVSFPFSARFSKLEFGGHMGHVHRIAIYNKCLTDTQLQRLTS